MKAFEDPEFRKLFSEYVDEMQDPANRQETEVNTVGFCDLQ